MDQATLVGPDIEIGRDALAALDAAGIKPAVALLAVLPEYDDWRLILSSPALDQNHQLKAYEKVTEILRGEFVYRLPPIIILPTKDLFIRELRRIFRNNIKVGPQTLVRLGGQRIGNRFVDNAYVYRVK
jgi:hypothetical protein